MTIDYQSLQVPDFRIGSHYYRLDPIREGAHVWRFRLLNDRTIKLTGIVPKGRVLSFRDSHGSEWLQICYAGLTVRRWYCWNGCTPKRYIPFVRVWIGTPDFRSTILASGVHDALYQFSCTEHFPLHRSDCDEIFKRIMLAHGAKPWLANLYYKAVRKFGRWDGDPSEKGEYSTVIHH